MHNAQWKMHLKITGFLMELLIINLNEGKSQKNLT